jgi:hypothetical protein
MAQNKAATAIGRISTSVERVIKKFERSGVKAEHKKEAEIRLNVLKDDVNRLSKVVKVK